MRLLTIHQPWAWLICAGHKRVENRKRPTNYRGPLLIHAGKSRQSLARGKARCDPLGIVLPERLDFGCVIGMVELFDCTDLVPLDPFAFGPVCLHLRSPVLFGTPIPWKGALGLVRAPAELVDRVIQTTKLPV